MRDPEGEGAPLRGAVEHRVTLACLDSLPRDVEAGGRVCARVRASCTAGCDLRGAALVVQCDGETLAKGALEEIGAGRGFEASLDWQAPSFVGEWVGAIVFQQLGKAA